MHNHVFLGQDIAGESLKEFTKSNSRVFLYTHCQGYGIARYAHRYMDWPKTLEQFKENEKKFNIKYACFFPFMLIYEFRHKNPEFFRYIRYNYRIKEIGLLKINKVSDLNYIILEKTNNSNPGDFYHFKAANQKLRAIYNILQNVIPCYSLRSK